MLSFRRVGDKGEARTSASVPRQRRSGPQDGGLADAPGQHLVAEFLVARAQAGAKPMTAPTAAHILELAGPVAWRDNPTVHGPSHLPLRLQAA